MNEIIYSPIGIVNSEYTSKYGMPIQSAFADGSRGTVEIKKEFIDALLGLDEFSHIYLIYHFHLMKSSKLVYASQYGPWVIYSIIVGLFCSVVYLNISKKYLIFDEKDLHE